MKKLGTMALALSVIALLAVGSAFAYNPIQLIVNGKKVDADVPARMEHDRVMVPVRWVAEALGAKVDWDDKQQKVTVDLPAASSTAPASSASDQRLALLDQWVAATSGADETANAWAKAVQMRNGAVQYALLAPELQAATESEFEQLNWVTGVSSPWIDSYAITKQDQASSDVWEYELEFKLKTSTGDAGTAEARLTVRQSQDAQQWRISDLHRGDSSDVTGLTYYNGSGVDGNPGAAAAQAIGIDQAAAMQMVDASVGFAWGTDGDQAALARTTDGGAHWDAVSLKGLELPAQAAPKFYFYDAATGWAGWTDDKQMNVAYTTDGGLHWTTVGISGQDHAVAFDFIDDRTGWLMTSGDAAMMHSQKKVYRTVDGGRTWQVVSSDTGYIPDDSATDKALPQVGQAEGIAFRNADEGWASIDNPVSKELEWYRSADAGKTWDAVSPAVPEAFRGKDYFTALSVPVFSGEQRQEGVMLIRFSTGDETATAAYRTHDGGATWDSGAVLPAAVGGVPMDHIAFADADHGWAIKGSSLYGTSDGGTTWDAVAADAAFLQTMQKDTHLLAFAAVDRQHIWVLTGSEDMREADLLHTADGGHTWTAAPERGASS